LALAQYEGMTPPDHVAAAHCLLHLADSEGVARLLASALGDASQREARELAYQVGVCTSVDVRVRA
jgi:hypothetical protein